MVHWQVNCSGLETRNMVESVLLLCPAHPKLQSNVACQWRTFSFGVQSNGTACHHTLSSNKIPKAKISSIKLRYTNWKSSSFPAKPMTWSPLCDWVRLQRVLCGILLIVSTLCFHKAWLLIFTKANTSQPCMYTRFRAYPTSMLKNQPAREVLKYTVKIHCTYKYTFHTLGSFLVGSFRFSPFFGDKKELWVTPSYCKLHPLKNNPGSWNSYTPVLDVAGAHWRIAFVLA